MNRILIIRGGAIGDFVLTLPTLKALRDRFPEATIEILGYKHIAAIAENRFYANAVRSIEYGALSSFFGRGGELDPELSSYFAGFDLVISYLFDPDNIFETNLRRAGVSRIIHGPAKVRAGSSAPRQLASPLQQLGIEISDYAPKVFPSEQDRAFARNFLDGPASPVIALHPGSGSAAKNWPLEHWIELGDALLGKDMQLLIVGGEAEQSRLATLQQHWNEPRVRLANNLPLPHLAAVLANSCFVGHDSGVSHLAAAAGANCVLLFGPTDPAVWAPVASNVQVIRAPDCDLTKLSVDAVLAAIWERRVM